MVVKEEYTTRWLGSGEGLDKTEGRVDKEGEDEGESNERRELTGLLHTDSNVGHTLDQFKGEQQLTIDYRQLIYIA